MLLYIVKRILIFIPTLFVISLLTFIISINTPGDPVELMILGKGGSAGPMASRMASQKAYEEKSRELGLHLPVFYFSITTAAQSDTLYRIQRESHRQTLKRFTYESGNWQKVSGYYIAVRAVERSLLMLKNPNADPDLLIEMRRMTHALYQMDNERSIRNQLRKMKTLLAGSEGFGPVIRKREEVAEALKDLVQNKEVWKNYIPSFHWYGIGNQYHRWVFGDGNNSKGIIRGDFGKSYETKLPVTEEIGQAVMITFNLSIAAIILSYLIALPLGIFSAAQRGSWKDQSITTILFILYSLPAFWIGTLLIVFLANPDFIMLFPTYGLGEIPANASWWEAFGIRAHHLALPLICLVYPTLAFLSRQARGSIVLVMQQDYIQTARAKGLGENKVVWRHGFRNALLPVITLFANVFPYAIAGSVVVEMVFSIPGMGKLTLDGLYARDYPLVFAVVMLSAVMTMAGYLVADILYTAADPRISYLKGKKG